MFYSLILYGAQSMWSFEFEVAGLSPRPCRSLRVGVWVGRLTSLHGMCLLYCVQGALTAALAVCDVDAKHAVRVAIRLLQEAGVWERPLGLVGVSGHTQLEVAVRLIKSVVFERREKQQTNGHASHALPSSPDHFHAFHVRCTLPRADAILCLIGHALPLGVGVGWGGACVAGGALATSRPHHMQPQGACDRAAAVAVDPAARARVCRQRGPGAGKALTHIGPSPAHVSRRCASCGDSLDAEMGLIFCV